MAPSASARQKERQASKIAKKALSKAQKKGDSNKDVVQVSVDDLITAAEHASDANDDHDKAIDLYSAALHIIQQQKNSADVMNINDQDEIVHTNVTNQHLDVLEKRAELYIGIGSQDKALEDFQSAIQILEGQKCEAPDSACLSERMANFHMNIGQLLEGENALHSFQNGIKQLEHAVIIRNREMDQNIGMTEDLVLKDAMEHDNNSKNQTPFMLLQETKRKLVSAYCSICELFMTDLCYEDNAEQQVESILQQALQITGLNSNNNKINYNEPCVDALQLAASHRLSQNRGLEAIEFILRAYEQMRIGCEALSTIVGLRESEEAITEAQGAVELKDLSEVQGLPSFEFRCQTAKILLECANTSEKEQSIQAVQGPQNDNKEYSQSQNLLELQQNCVNYAVDVLGSLLSENDEVVEIWNLLGDNFALKNRIHRNRNDDKSISSDDKDVPIYYWQRATEMLETVQTSLTIELRNASNPDMEDDFQCQLDEILCLLEEIRGKIDDLNNEGDQPMEE
jgi:tetratricopeptide (TPR) repeat protein